MAIYSVDIEKLYQNEYWTNRYLVQVADLAGGQVAGSAIANMERNFHQNTVTFTRYRVSDNTPNTDVYTTVPLNLPGLRGSVGEYMPLFNVVRVDFGVAGGGRPSRKYYRLPLGEGDQAGGILADGTVTAVDNALQPILAQPVCDPQGQIWVSIAVARQVGMRQLRRGSKRRLRPIIV
jgi:hypothetical protein